MFMIFLRKVRLNGAQKVKEIKEIEGLLNPGPVKVRQDFSERPNLSHGLNPIGGKDGRW